MSKVKFMTKSEYKDYIKYGFTDLSYDVEFECNKKLSKLNVLEFLSNCCNILGVDFKEFNRLYMVESDSRRKVNNAYEFILNKVGYAISPIKSIGETMICNPQCVYTNR